MQNEDTPKIGVYVCHCGFNIAQKVDVEDVAEFASKLPGVTVARDYRFMCSDPGQALIRQDLEQGVVNRVVVASCSPLMHEKTFRAAVGAEGVNPFLFQMTNIREHVSWVTGDEARATAKARALVAAAVRRVGYHKPLESRKVPVHQDALILGGGIAGLSAALTLAESGKTVWLVERLPSVGGTMAKFDKTFPTLDCAGCTLTPKMTAAGQHPNIKLLTYSELEELGGYVGNFNARIRRKSRYVDWDKCNGCAACQDVCPVSISNTFDHHLAERKAIYRLFPQAVPNRFTIDRQGQSPCAHRCPADIAAHGYIALARAGRYDDAYKLVMEKAPLPGVLGRTCPAPCQGECTRGAVDEPLSIRRIKRFLSDRYYAEHEPETEREPDTGKRIEIIGSGPAGLSAAYFLAKKGHKVQIHEALPEPGGMLKVGIPDFRLPPAALERDIANVTALGVEIETNHRVDKAELEQMLDSSDAVLLAAGAHRSKGMGIPGEDLQGVAPCGDFLREVNLGEGRDLSGKRVMVVGGGNAAIDSSRTALRLGAAEVVQIYRRSRAEMPAWAEEVDAAEEEGVELQLLATPVEYVGEGGQLTQARCLKMELGAPDKSGRRRPVPIEGSEYLVDVDLVVMAIGLEPEIDDVLPEGVERTRWGTIVTDEKTMMTARAGLFSAGDVVLGPATIVQAIGQGRRAAEAMDAFLRDEEYVPSPEWELPTREEIFARIGRPQAEAAPPIQHIEMEARTSTFDEVEQVMTEKEIASETLRCLDCATCCDCRSCETVCEAQAIDFQQEDEIIEVSAGAVIVATGFKAFDPKPLEPYGYGKFPEVYTSLDLERLSAPNGPTQGKIQLRDGSNPEQVAIIHCIGSRDKNTNEYCSRVCCMASIKLAHLVHEKTGAEVVNFYIDIRAFGKGYEEFYGRILDEGVRFVRGKVVEVNEGEEENEGKMIVRANDTLLGEIVEVPVDMVVLAVGMEPQEDAPELARKVGLSVGRDGFFLERHLKLAPSESFSAGVFLAGTAQGPKDIPDSVSSAGAAGHEALSLITRGEVTLEPTTSHIDPDICAGCQMCVHVCPFGAPYYNEETRTSIIEDALCKGCGLCAATCPSGAADQNHFQSFQLLSELEGILMIG